MFEKEAEEYIKEHTFFDEEYGVQSLDVVSKTIFKDGAEFGYNKAKEEWKKHFLQCSSPFCLDNFSEVKCYGELGNMAKKESE
jgi:hypothetical protein